MGVPSHGAWYNLGPPTLRESWGFGCFWFRQADEPDRRLGLRVQVP